jgi:predicted nucleotidyltransferase component of viral defense system
MPSATISTDLDFTGIGEHDHEDVILDMMAAFEQPFHGIQFAIPDNAYYETQDGLSWGVNPTYAHEWNSSGASEVRVQVSRRETPTLPTERLAQIEQSYFKVLPFVPSEITCLALPEILAEKIRACYQRSKAHDIHDLGTFARRPLDQPLIRRLVVLKLWQAGDTFDPARLMQKFTDGQDFDWDDLRQLLNRAVVIDTERICEDCVHGFGFLAELTDDERLLARDQYQRVHAAAERVRVALR